MTTALCDRDTEMKLWEEEIETLLDGFSTRRASGVIGTVHFVTITNACCPNYHTTMSCTQEGAGMCGQSTTLQGQKKISA